MPAHTVPVPWEPAPKPILAMLHCLPRVKRCVFPPLSSEGPCYEVLRVISGVSVPQANLFQSSPGDVICKVLLPMTTGFTCPGPGPSPSSISPKAQLSLLNLLSQEQPQELSVLFITSEDGNDRGMVSLEHVILTFLFFPPKNCVYNLKYQSLPWRHTFNLLTRHWRRKSRFILPSMNNFLSVYKKEWDYWHMLLDAF